jgi:hypothetical protein
MMAKRMEKARFTLRMETNIQVIGSMTTEQDKVFLPGLMAADTREIIHKCLVEIRCETHCVEKHS